jgi:dihydroorotate dehydrogenase
MYRRIRPLLFCIDPERAHNLIINLMAAAGSLSPIRKFLQKFYFPKIYTPVDFAGLSFPNPVGLAAGYDKNGVSWLGLSLLGFGHIEIGTVTPRPQAGNPKPRVFRFPDEEAIINRMGFPGKGAEFAVEMIPKPGCSPARDNIILGMNIGMNEETLIEDAAQDYIDCLKLFYDRVDYIAVNVSSPNTIGLRKLQGRDLLEGLLQELMSERDRLQLELDRPLPVFVKLSPDLSDHELDDALEAITGTSVDGVIAANTTIYRENLLDSDPGVEGGLSGKPIKELSTSLIRKIHRRTAGNLPIIGVGGISSPDDAREKMEAGAGLVQIYSGLIFQGPRLVRDLLENL